MAALQTEEVESCEKQAAFLAVSGKVRSVEVR